MSESGTEPSFVSQPPVAAPKVRNTTAILTTVVVIQSVVILLLVLVLGGFVWNFGGLPWGMEGPDEEVFMLSEEVVSDVGYLLSQGDVEEYMELYAEDDAYIDRAEVRDDFVKASAAATGSVDFMSDMNMSSYIDAETDETIVEVILSGADSYTGMPRGPRLRVYAIQTEGDWLLTGIKGRDVEADDTYW